MATVGEPEVSGGREGAAVADAFPTRHLPRPEVRDHAGRAHATTGG